MPMAMTNLTQNHCREPDNITCLFEITRAMKILLHICCGPCTTFPLVELRHERHAIEGYFYNPNIHPFKEFERRLGAVMILAEQTGLVVHYEKAYGLKEYLRAVVFHEEERCRRCYAMRLAATAQEAKRRGADAFSSTLLYSKFQRHELIRQVAEETAAAHDIAFYYRDFRPGWQEGIKLAKEMGLYRQPYCGCIYSEQERYDRSFNF